MTIDEFCKEVKRQMAEMIEARMSAELFGSQPGPTEFVPGEGGRPITQGPNEHHNKKVPRSSERKQNMSGLLVSGPFS